MVPHLTTALTGPLLELEKEFLTQSTAIEAWFRGQWQQHMPPFYASCDLRNSGFKLAPVDTNLFPGGFNNLHDAMLPLSVQASMSAIERLCPEAKSLLLIPEKHTRNRFYLANVAQLMRIMRQAGLNARIGSISPEIDVPTRFELENGETLLLEPLRLVNGKLLLDDFEPCAVLLNNDLSSGVPELLQSVSDQIIMPPLRAGWGTRRKSRHFGAYEQLANEFAMLLNIDAWRINPMYTVCQSINFHERQGIDCLANNVTAILDNVREKYREYGVTETPYVVVKADAGTYGMGVMTVRNADELTSLNRKQRNKMSVVKEGLEVSEVLVQEGVHTFEQLGDAFAEPVVYMIDRYVVGGFYRVHTERGRDENLNAPGMHFEPLSFETGCNMPDPTENPDAPPNRFYAYGVISRLACLATALELDQALEDEEAKTLSSPNQAVPPPQAAAHAPGSDLGVLA